MPLLTPYAILQVRPADGDDAIRARFHVLARHCHPDAILTQRGANFVKLKADWELYSGAYAKVKTAALRTAWERGEALLAGRCGSCRGVGVTGGALGAIKICQECKGEGRKVKGGR
jgi:DnaJ-class molecular chaperone